jgi:TRAP-type C4-dicarboxylate transport system permease small subunit
MRRLIERFDIFLASIAGISMLFLTALTTYEVVQRYFFNAPTSWSLEIIEYLVVVCVYLGMSYSIRKGAHVSVPLLYEKLPARAQRIVDVITSILLLLFWLVFLWQTAATAIDYLMRGVRSETLLAFPLFYPMAIVAIGSLMSCLQTILVVYDSILRLSGNLSPDTMSTKHTR